VSSDDNCGAICSDGTGGDGDTHRNTIKQTQPATPDFSGLLTKDRSIDRDSTDPQWFFEDFSPGDVYQTRSRTVTETDLVTFVGFAGFFEEIFITVRGGTKTNGALSPEGRMIPGVMIIALAEGLYVLSDRMQNGLALLEMDAVRFSKPVICGDTIHAVVAVAEVYPTRSGKRGLVVLDQHVETDRQGKVLQYRTKRVIARRPA
jgi:acyl dehydratase